MSKKVKKTDQQVVDEFIDTFTPSNLIEKISLTFGDRHEHIDFDDFMPMKKHMKKKEKENHLHKESFTQLLHYYMRYS